MGKLANLIKNILPKRAPTKATAFTSTFNPYLGDHFLPLPLFRDHIVDLEDLRQNYDSQQLLELLFRQDPDVSATVNAYLTLADTEPMFYVYDKNGQFDDQGHSDVLALVDTLTSKHDYVGFTVKHSLNSLCERMRYMVLLRGAISAELILNELHMPVRANMVDPHSLMWIEKETGVYTAKQRTRTTGQFIDLTNLPTFFTVFYRQSPLAIYMDGCFVSAINTLSARQQVINDLYRIMKVTGFPRIDITVLEEVLIKSAPANVRNDSQMLRNWMNARLQEMGNVVAGLRADQPFAHMDSVEVKIINDHNPGTGIDISQVISVLNGQNQAALKTMSTIIGRGESGTNTGSVECRIFSMNADQINKPVADLLSQMLTYALRLQGSESTVKVEFRPAEMRSASELEPQLTLKAARLREDLSLGIISDFEYAMEMFGRLPLASAPKLQGTGFMAPQTSDGQPDPTPNSDPLGRSLQPTGSKTARSMTKSNSTRKPNGR